MAQQHWLPKSPFQSPWQEISRECLLQSTSYSIRTFSKVQVLASTQHMSSIKRGHYSQCAPRPATRSFEFPNANLPSIADLFAEILQGANIRLCNGRHNETS